MPLVRIDPRRGNDGTKDDRFMIVNEPDAENFAHADRVISASFKDR
jgi:hypothetical protein